MRHISLIAATFGLMACAGSADDVENLPRPEAPELAVEVVAKIRNGQVTTDRPEVGRIGGCTATLVAPDVAICAAHCVGYRTRTSIGNYNTFRVIKDGETRRYTVNRYRSFGNGLGRNDISLLGLSESVPADLATPAPLARSIPAEGTSLTVYGYGCTQIGRSGDGRKRSATYQQGDRAQHLCPGDSGGPVFNDETGAVLRINSGYQLDRGRTDIYGLVPGLHDDLLEQIQEWSDGDVPQEGEPPSDLDPDVKICGRNVDVYESWTCTVSRIYRYRCLPGGSPSWERCESSCVSSSDGEADACGRPEGLDTCGDTYRPYVEWVCATDDVTILRCNAGQLEFRRCERGCVPGPGADACEE